MANRAAEFLFTGSTTAISSYNSTQTNLGQWIVQNNGGTNLTNYAGPFQIVLGRPGEAVNGVSSAIITLMPYVIDLGNGTHWVFLSDGAATAATRRVVLYTFNTSTQALTWIGFITLTYPPNTNHIIRGFGVVRHTYSTGTVTVSGTGVTGSSTAWQTAGYAVGGRIGFGFTNPNSITTWYIISAIGSDTSITLSGSGPSVSGSVFVIEELRVYTANTNTTALNGGLFVGKGINYNDFTSGGTTIAAATSTDNIKAVYWLADASTVTNTAPGGLAINQSYTDTTCTIYTTNGASTSLIIYKYNGRASLSGLSSGKSTSAFVLATGTQTVTGTLSQTQCCILATLSHGPGSGVSCLYVASTSRISRIIESNIISGTTSFVADVMVEIPPGSVNTYAATSNMLSLTYMSTIDRLLIFVSISNSNLCNLRSYVTRYQTNAYQFDRVLFSSDSQEDESTANAGLAPYPSATYGGVIGFDLNGITYMVRNYPSFALAQLYVVPLSTDWDFAYSTNCRLISPSIPTTNCVQFSKFVVIHRQQIGSTSLGLPAEAYRTYYRTSGITDNSGTWIFIDDTGDLTGAIASNNIQFMFEFRVIGPFCIPAKIYGFTVTYQDKTTDSHFQASVALSNATNKQFVWRFASGFGGTVPTLNVYIYDEVSGNLLVTDNTVSQANGTFTKSTNGSSFSTYNTTDKANTTTYIMYTPTTLGDNFKARAILTQQ